MNILINTLFVMFSVLLLVLALISPNMTTGLSVFVLSIATLTMLYIIKHTMNDDMVLETETESWSGLLHSYLSQSVLFCASWEQSKLLSLQALIVRIQSK